MTLESSFEATEPSQTGDAYKFPEVISFIEREIDWHRSQRGLTSGLLHAATSLLFQRNIFDSQEEFDYSGELHAIRAVFRAKTLEKINPWNEEVRAELVEFLTRKYPKGIEVWDPNGPYDNPEHERVKQMIEAVRQGLKTADKLV